MKENATATNFEPHKCVNFVQSTKIGTQENKAIHSNRVHRHESLHGTHLISAFLNKDAQKYQTCRLDDQFVQRPEIHASGWLVVLRINVDLAKLSFSHVSTWKQEITNL